MSHIMAARSFWSEALTIPPLGPKTRAATRALEAVLLWSTWPALAPCAQPAPPFLILAPDSGAGFVLSPA